MSGNINLFEVVDSKEQYEKFSALAHESYTELQSQIKNKFQFGVIFTKCSNKRI